MSCPSKRGAARGSARSALSSTISRATTRSHWTRSRPRFKRRCRHRSQAARPCSAPRTKSDLLAVAPHQFFQGGAAGRQLLVWNAIERDGARVAERMKLRFHGLIDVGQTPHVFVLLHLAIDV